MIKQTKDFVLDENYQPNTLDEIIDHISNKEMIASDLEKWKVKSLKRLREGESAAVEFVSDFIPESMTIDIKNKLESCKTAEDVRAVFGTNGHKAEVDPMLALVAELKRANDILEAEMKYSEDQPRDESGRWTDGGGGGDQSPKEDNGGRMGSREDLLASYERYQEEQKQKAPTIAKEMGIPEDKFIVHDEYKYEQREDGAYSGIAGEYDPDTGEIHIYKDGYSEGETVLRGVIAHEQSHAMWFEGGSNDKPLDKLFTEEFGEKEGISLLNKLQESDGITEYSSWHWDNSHPRLAINETIAEVAMMKITDRWDEVPEPWKETYNAIEKRYMGRNK